MIRKWFGFCWVRVPLLTMVISSIAFLGTTYLLTTHKQVVSMYVGLLFSYHILGLSYEYQ